MNRLAQESSPYLRQHADNPVEWYPWGDDAFDEARRRDVPVLLSVGYSSCHWCHVMAHESFEDPAIAQRMNDGFVSVKVDREERPDVDGIYMQAVQAMSGRGGWPMTVFLTPDGLPFYAGTYYPPEDRHGMPGFTRVLDAIADAWRTRRAELVEQAGRVHEVLAAEASFRPPVDEQPAELSTDAVRLALATARDQFDARSGGFGPAPKFPPSGTIELLLRAHVRDSDDHTIAMAATTLDHMAAGGMYDQVGGGFHRYSVDQHWLVPHFEKMLYDQALLTRAYLHAFLVTRRNRYRRAVEETITYARRDLRHPDGGFYSAEDADSEGHEGRFYVWSLDEIERVCGADAPEVVRYYGVTAGGNFEGTNILHVADPGEERPAAVGRGRDALFAARAGRVRPGLDDKVLLGWNGLFLRALTEAASVFHREEWMDAARTNAQFLLRELRRDDGRFLRSWQPDAETRDGWGATGRARHLAYAEDYAALLGALVTLAERDEIGWLEPAFDVADGLLHLFLDRDAGGFFTTGTDAEALIVRPKDLFDGATPSATSLAADALLRLAALSGRTGYDEPAFAALRFLGPLLERQPSACVYALEALERATSAPIEVAVVGEPGADATRALWQEVTGRFLPDSVITTARPERGAADLSPLLADRSTVAGRPAAYVCAYYACERPVTDAAGLRAQLDDALAARSA